ncbi:P450 cytochrome, putative [[Leptolyngbya] sp. PCC 7376]|uniref:SLOG cluster 4 domain-containing protein n=1 Tax=[Leptolyngbya] sp. PCC 7376 TaxID=111781 RepID=UPI00029EEAD9|nr:LOG family protein [[Leptolyngbya] sp. PCC 7376]AFY40326.1 P450 cytochrome, putative [[Leptolyngbya] sp. PCC 7376]
MSQKKVVGVMGAGGGATLENLTDAYELGQAIATNGWATLTGGRPAGVMEAASRGAKGANGLTVGVLPGGDRRQASEFVDIVICTDLGNARNNVNVLSSNAVVAVGMGMGTASEVALAIKNSRPVILLKPDAETIAFFCKFAPDQIEIATTIKQAIAFLEHHLT